MVCRLTKAIYGLKQSPRAWFEKFRDIAKKGGFQRCTVDHSVFFRHTQTGGIVIMAVYVDDIILTGSDDQGILEAQTFLKSHFVCRDMGRPRYFLGIEFAYRLQEISLSQRKYVLDLLQETGQLGCKPECTPVELTPPYWDTSSPVLDDPTSYIRLVGKLIYLTVTRPDISFAVGLLSQFMQEPKVVHWQGVMRVLAYFKATPGKGLLYRR